MIMMFGIQLLCAFVAIISLGNSLSKDISTGSKVVSTLSVVAMISLMIFIEAVLKV